MTLRTLILIHLLALPTAVTASAQGGGPSPGAGGPRPFVMPSRAKPIPGVIHEALLSPIYRGDFVCSQHFSGQLDFAGDALGTDCMKFGGVEGDSGFPRLYRTTGTTNEDWYGWNAEVLSPVTGTVVGVIQKPKTNSPGTMSKPPAAMLQIRTRGGLMVVLAHLTKFRVALGQSVKAGDVVGLVGNNGFARAPHIHVGAYVEKTAEPLQIRWDLDAMSKLRG